ncbi:MAG: sigma-70 family RNA polymerase sigma factor [Acidobacteriaceae bacterium]|nr:sigma-70 family RNA polymerase sigma factor [Acidobacteriaceae bacterium]MBV8572209.1 sigma-70 family RNA polymerase sigma factor [Acidobacteriaceae bacterium]
MEAVEHHEVTELLLKWRRGEESALDQLMPLVYNELRRLAHRYMVGERCANTLQTTALVNEAYIKLVDSRRVQWQDRAHFLAVAAQLMRRILVDLARARRSQKRGAEVNHVPIEAAMSLQSRTRDLVQLDGALTNLAAKHARRAQVVEMRFFGGLSVSEVAEALGVSEDTVLRDWRLARVWLFRALNNTDCDAT